MSRRRDTQARRANKLPRLGSGNLRSIYERDGGICHLCSNKIARGQESRDHITPATLSGSGATSEAGGADRARNYRIAHKGCNTARGNLPLKLAYAAIAHWREQNTTEIGTGALYRPKVSESVARTVLAAALRDWRRRFTEHAPDGTAVMRDEEETG